MKNHAYFGIILMLTKWVESLSKRYYKVRWNYYKLRQLSLLQSAMDCYYKLRQLFYYKVRHGLLQIATVLQSAKNLLQIATRITKCDEFITNCDRYYKVRWLLQIATVQLDYAAFTEERKTDNWFLGGRTNDKIWQYNKSRLSLFLLDNRKWRAYHL